MAATHLTARFCASARPKDGKDGSPVQTAYPDDDPKGLELRVSAEGGKVWSYRYRTLDGRQRRLTLGTFVDDEAGTKTDLTNEATLLTLKAARRVARQARAVVEAGGDPAAEKRKAKEAARSQPIRSFDELADAYLLACETGEWKPKGRRKRERTLKDERNILQRYVRPTLGALPLRELSRPTMKKLLRGMVARGIGAQTNRTQAVVRQVYAWAIAEEIAELNPATGFAPLATEKPRARVLSDAELRAVWGALNAPGEHPIKNDAEEDSPLHLSRPVAIILQLATLLLQRRSEIAGMRFAEVNLEEATWIIPAERAKSGRQHLVPLPDEAVTLIREGAKLAQLQHEKAACVFPSLRDPAKPISSDTVSHAFADVAKACRIVGITAHDLRRTGASAMASERLGLPPFIVSRVLAHSADAGGAAAVTLHHYTVYDFAPEKRRALEAWSDLLLNIVEERPGLTKKTTTGMSR